MFTKDDTPFFKDAQGVNAGGGAVLTGRKEKIDRDVDRLMAHKRPNAKHCQHEEPKHL